MTFSLSTSLTHINIDESSIIDIYRSACPVTPPDPMYGGHPCEAYLCTGREGNLLLAYVAILDTKTRIPFIFTSACDAKDAAACRQVVAEANDFIASMGFSLEKVNIDYGAAMRQVVIRNLRIMRPPPRPRTAQTPKKQAPAGESPIDQAGTGTPPQEVSPPPSRPRQVPGTAASSHAEASPDGDSLLAAELSALQAAFERLAQEKSEAETNAGQAIADLTAQLEHAVAARTKAEKSGRDALAQHRQADDARLREMERLESELKLAAEARLAAEDALAKEIARHRESEARASGEIARLEAALEGGRTRHAETEARLHKAEADLREAGNDLEAEANRRAESETAAKKRERELRKELGALREEGNATGAMLRDREERCRSLTEERDRLRDRLAEALDTAPPEHAVQDAELVREAELLKDANQALTGQQEEARREHDLAMGALEAELRTASEKREHELRKELAALREEGNATGAMLRDREERCRSLTQERDRLRDRLAEALDTATPEPEHVVQDAGLVREAELLKDANQALAGQLEEARREHGLVMGALEAELRTAFEKAESLEADVERLASEKRSRDSLGAAFKKKVRYAVERLKKEKQELEEELRRLRERIDERPLPLPPVTPDAAGPVIAPSLVMAEADAESPPPAATPTMGTSLGSPGSAFQSGDAVFRHNPDLTTISCHSPDEVTEVHSSINAIQAGPFGRKPQVCLAYVLGVRHGKKTAVYLAWLLQEERCVLVCTPEKQPENAAGYAAIMRDAIFYFESTGFMMDRLDLSKAVRVQLKALEQSGVCRFDGHQAPRASTG